MESVLNFREIFLNFPLPTIILSEDLVVREINQTFQLKFGASRLNQRINGESIDEYFVSRIESFISSDLARQQHINYQFNRIVLEEEFLILVTFDSNIQFKADEQLVKAQTESIMDTLNEIPVMMLIMDEQQNVIAWNTKCLETLKYPSKMTEEMLLSFQHEIKKVFNDSSNYNACSRYEKTEKCVKMKCLTNEEKIISWYGFSNLSLMDTTNQVIFGFDITRREKSAEALVQKNYELEQIFKALPDIYIKCTKDLEIKEIKGRIEMLGVSENILGQNLCALLPLFCENKVYKEEALRVLREKTQAEFELDITSERGKQFFDCRIIFLNDEELLVLLQNITERKNFQLILNESEMRYRTFFNMCPDVIFLLDLEKGYIIEANPAFHCAFGIECCNNFYDNYRNYIEDEYIDVVKLMKKKIDQGKKALGAQVILVNKDDKPCHFVLHAIPIFQEGHPKRALCLGHEITARVKMNEMKELAEKHIKLLNEAVEYERFRTEFFANISHEFKTPINVILGGIQLLEMYSSNSIDVELSRKINKLEKNMKQNCFRLIRLVNNFIDITRLDSGFMKLKLVNCNMVDLIEEIVDSVDEYAVMKKLNLQFVKEIDEVIMACDPDKIERIILNLVSNAIKFTKEGDHITVKITTNETNEVLISVKDTGIGIKKADLEVIFERFRQVNKSFSRVNEGSGIGLSLVKSLVELHGGRVEVDSILGEGSEFLISLPINNIIDSDDYYIEEDCKKVSIELSDIYV